DAPRPVVLGATPAPRPQQLPLGGVAGDERVLPAGARERGAPAERGRPFEAAREKDLSLRERIHVHAARRIVPGAPDLLHPHEVAGGVVPREEAVEAAPAREGDVGPAPALPGGIP